MTMPSTEGLSIKLAAWYRANQRELPWRTSREAYRIWISEVMLQQTTVAVVIPYYERFMARFPDVKTLAEASIEEVLPLWAGLGYYSRARNIHKTAQLIAGDAFPSDVDKLLALPGLGPYTARAIASIAFDLPVGVLDGNVIRVLSRVLGLRVEFWKTQGRNDLQNFADQIARAEVPSVVNQGMMDLGATVCTPQKPLCLLCPWSKECIARATDQVEKIPMKKPRRKKEIWIWSPDVRLKNGTLALVQNDYAPFLKGSWLFPGTAAKVEARPEKFDLRHTITHHEIYVQLASAKARRKGEKWISLDTLTSVNPSALLSKVLKARERSYFSSR